MTYLVDSDLITSGLNGVSVAVDLLDRLADDGLAVSTVSIGEIFEGAYGAPEPDTHLASARRFLSGFRVLAVSLPVAETFARIRFMLRRQGNTIPDLDLLIAATAVTHELTLVTRNHRHFARLPELRLLDG